MQTKIEQIKEYLTKLIMKNIEVVNYKLPSENVICRIFSVSRITAKTALNDLENQGIIFRHQGKGSFISAEAKEKLYSYAERKKIEFIGLILPDIKSNFMLNLINGIEETLNNTNYRIVLQATNYSQSQEQMAIQDFLKIGVKGFLIYPVDNQTYNQEILKLIIQKFPFVLLDRTLPGLNASVVNSNNEEDIKKAMEYLISIGHKNVGIISTRPEGTNTITERINGYELALKENKISIKGSYIFTDLINYDPEWEKKISSYFLNNPKLTAVISINSDICHKTLRVLNKLKIKVPEEMSVISYADDYSEFLDLMSLKLTSIHQDPKKIGTAASELLIQNINNNEIKIKHIQISSTFIVRDSTKPV